VANSVKSRQEIVILVHLRPAARETFADSAGCSPVDVGSLWVESALYPSLAEVVAPYVRGGEAVSMARLDVDGLLAASSTVEVEHRPIAGRDRGAARVVRVVSRLRDVATGDVLVIDRQLALQPAGTVSRGAGAPGAAERRGEAATVARAIGDPNPRHTDASPGGGVLPGVVVLARAIRLYRETTQAPEPVRRVTARFARPVYPGQLLEVERIGDGEFKVLAAGVTVIRSVRLGRQTAQKRAVAS
jgi:hypothetical protein